MKVVGTSVNGLGHLLLELDLSKLEIDGHGRIIDARQRATGRLAATKEGQRVVSLLPQWTAAKSKPVAATARLDQLKRERREAEDKAGSNLGAELVRIDEEMSRVERDANREVEVIEPVLGLAKSALNDKAESIAGEMYQEFMEEMVAEAEVAKTRLTELLEDNDDVRVLAEIAATAITMTNFGPGGLQLNLMRSAVNALTQPAVEATAAAEPVVAGRRRR